ncbi:MAG: hypothetical protein FJX72_11830 [Armatimonadetes bacterium]|nr:hypothetical protein [Armatimonadota bacterium]
MTEDDFYQVRSRIAWLIDRTGNERARDLLCEAIVRMMAAQIEEFPRGACAAIVAQGSTAARTVQP